MQNLFTIFLSLGSYLTVLLAIVSVTGGLSWFIVCSICKTYNSSQALMEVAACALLASLIDLDHFLAARSLYLKDATSLKQRPPLHCSTFPLLICGSILLYSYISQVGLLKRGALIIFTAFASHHTRDATRRGFWFYPLGSTPPLPYGVYITTTAFYHTLFAYCKNMLGFIKVAKAGNFYWYSLL